MPATRNIRSGRVMSSATPPSPSSRLSMMIEQPHDIIFSPISPEESSPEPCRPTKRRSAGRKSADHIRRPRNAFIIFRSHLYRQLREEHAKLPGDRQQNQQNELSKMAAKAWGSMSKEQREPFKQVAEREKAAHKLMYPNYVYAPGGKAGNGKSKPTKKTTQQSRRRKDTPVSSPSSSPSPPPHSSQPTPHLVFPFSHPPRRAAAQRASEKISQMDIPSPSHSSHCSVEDLVARVPDDDCFVSTSDIPPLDLNATEPANDELQYPDIENYLSFVEQGNMHFNIDGTFANAASLGAPYYDLKSHYSFISEPTMPNSLLPVYIDVDGGLDVGSYELDPNVFDASAIIPSPYPLLSCNYQEGQAHLSQVYSNDQLDMNQFLNWDMCP
ncbi:hypothetical protein CVT24_013012 [Panaeolus cyanescens]|uniref:HMG box domain-containing protein n=1 Tax=Panaeolus cyanescens TaxID=181874 RepID=A0A409VVP6_9AGAR|nr:hypothetical protein CVT24_013012 [Panaeolus cyanescens]